MLHIMPIAMWIEVVSLWLGHSDYHADLISIAFLYIYIYIYIHIYIAGCV